MSAKDYYDLLDLHPGAPEAAIKKAFRKLAMRYHPDRNAGNPYAVHHFREIQEAYEVLSNPVRRNEYHQKRNKHSATGRGFNPQREITPEMILQEAVKIERFIAGVDVFRMDHISLLNNLLQLLNDEHLKILKEKHHSETNKKILNSVLKSLQPVSYPGILRLKSRLFELSDDIPDQVDIINEVLREKKQQYLWDKYKGVLMLLIALGVSFLIYKIA